MKKSSLLFKKTLTVLTNVHEFVLDVETNGIVEIVEHRTPETVSVPDDLVVAIIQNREFVSTGVLINIPVLDRDHKPFGYENVIRTEVLEKFQLILSNKRVGSGVLHLGIYGHKPGYAGIAFFISLVSFFELNEISVLIQSP